MKDFTNILPNTFTMSKIWLQIQTTPFRVIVLVVLCLGVLLVYVISQHSQLGFHLSGEKRISGTATVKKHCLPTQPNGAGNFDNRTRYTDSLRSEPSDEIDIGQHIYKFYASSALPESLSSASQWKSTQLSKSNYRSSSGHVQAFHNKTSNCSKEDVIMTLNIVQQDEKANETGAHVFEMSLYNTQFANYPELQQARIQRIKDACAAKGELSKTNMYRATATVIYKSEVYNFTFCKVPKSGSTFWTKAFGILKYGVTYADNIFQKSRKTVHASMGQYTTTMNEIIRDQSRTILVSRCPYSRLFSAYIDKSFLQFIKEINYSVRNFSKTDIDKSPCQANVTFQEFLDWVILQGKSGKTLNRHWAPIVSLCQPCSVNPYILVKQESFIKDVEFAFEQLRVEKSKYDFLTKALNDHRAELSLPGIISTVFQHAGVPVVKQCLGFKTVAKRTWTSLQIQGFIDDNIEFPEKRFRQDQFSNSTYFSGLILQIIKAHPMNSSQSESQRLRFLYDAYRSVNVKTIKGIQQMFKQDFEIFGYSKLPPTEY